MMFLIQHVMLELARPGADTSTTTLVHFALYNLISMVGSFILAAW